MPSAAAALALWQTDLVDDGSIAMLDRVAHCLAREDLEKLTLFQHNMVINRHRLNNVPTVELAHNLKNNVHV